MKKRVYIAGPISQGILEHNLWRADYAFRQLMLAGFAPLCPHWSVYHGSARQFHDIVLAQARVLPEYTTHEDWLGVDLPWVAVSDAVLRLEGESVGADREVALAESLGIPVFTSIEELKEAFRGPEV